jgi:hypothetical protein
VKRSERPREVDPRLNEIDFNYARRSGDMMEQTVGVGRDTNQTIPNNNSAIEITSSKSGQRHAVDLVDQRSRRSGNQQIPFSGESSSRDFQGASRSQIPQRDQMRDLSREEFGMPSRSQEQLAEDKSFPYKMNVHPRVLDSNKQKPGVDGKRFIDPRLKDSKSRDLDSERQRKYNLRHKYEESKANLDSKLKMKFYGKF